MMLKHLQLCMSLAKRFALVEPLNGFKIENFLICHTAEKYILHNTIEYSFCTFTFILYKKSNSFKNKKVRNAFIVEK